MSYHLYNTHGFILRTANVGEANKVLFVFTEDLGLIPVQVQAGRKISSKLRLSLRGYSFCRFSLIRGKTSWRLTDAEELISFSPASEPEKIKIFAGILLLIGRFVHGEEENGKLFSALKDAAVFLKNTKFTVDELRRFETLSVLKTLSSLGYIGENKALAYFIQIPFSKQTMEEFVPFRRQALLLINQALKESHL